MATANAKQTIDATGVDVFVAGPDGGPCLQFIVAIRDAPGKNDALVNVQGLHATGEFIGMIKGSFIIFELDFPDNPSFQIQKVTVKGDGGETVVDSGVVKRGQQTRN